MYLHFFLKKLVEKLCKKHARCSCNVDETELMLGGYRNADNGYNESQ